ncbi:hypothetical protein SBRCBS47491_008896 [Sporothrix bragantina]|uniref:Zn(2)-C6 fungal-type domain-containing protein n=1 Tax=Sporothrix bragantina TaxID=671064 RepID=A0ABP0CSX1_9PEZI
MAPAFQDMTSTFVLSVTSSSDKAVLAELPKGLLRDPSRQRQSHRKSRAGCDNCKRRRVKCNEEVPCASCRRRGETCERPGHQSQLPVPKPMDTIAPFTSSTVSSAGTNDSVVNLLHLKLLHHFQVHTCPTLVFGTDAWATALQLGFHFEFLSNAVLCVAARHLAYLHANKAETGSVDGLNGPDAATYAATAATHLCRSLAGFRHELVTRDFTTATHLDAFIATSTLLQFELWSSTDFLPHGGQRLDLDRDRLLTFSASLKLVFLKSVPEALHRQPNSVFMPYIRHNPATSLLEHSRITTELVPALLMTDLTRSVFSFPILCRISFVDLLHENDLDAFFLLYHFYRIIHQLLPQKSCWWAQGRAAVMEQALYDWLQTT